MFYRIKYSLEPTEFKDPLPSSIGEITPDIMVQVNREQVFRNICPEASQKEQEQIKIKYFQAQNMVQTKLARNKHRNKKYADKNITGVKRMVMELYQ